MKKHIYSIVSFLSISMSSHSLLAGVDIEKYRRANPDPLDAIPAEGTVTLGKKLGSGQTVVYNATVIDPSGKTHKIAAKPYGRRPKDVDYGSWQKFNYNQEVQAIQNLRNANVLGSDDLVSRVDGLRVVATPKVLADGTIIMELIQGMNVAEAVMCTDSSQSPFANGYINDPQKQVQCIGGLLGGLNSLHKLGLVHLDIKLENYMIEKREFPREEVEAKIEARARQMTGITGEEKDLTEGNKRTLNAARETARAYLKFEDLYEFCIRIIDVGTLTPKGKKSPLTDLDWEPPERSVSQQPVADPSDDMYRFATTLPSLLFGKVGNHLQGIFQNSKCGQFAQMRKGQCWKSAIETVEISFIDQVFPETAPSKKQYLEITDRINTQLDLVKQFQLLGEFSAQISHLKNQLESFIEKHRKELYAQKGREMKAMIQQLMQPMTSEDIHQFMFEQLQIINEEMKINTGQSYPEPVLMEFAEIMTDCLSEDPTQRPTAKTVFRKVTHLALSDWKRDEAGEYRPENTYRIEGMPNL